jgi:general stress protein 26
MDRTREGLRELWEKIRDVRVAMLTTAAADGRLHSRPMYTQQEELPDGLWFLTSRTSEKAREVMDEHDVNLAYADPGKNLYVSVAGRGRLVDDRAKARELWNRMNEAFFPGGPDDPDLVLLHVEPTSAEYWEGPSGKVQQLFAVARTMVTGDARDMGENEEIEL